MNVLLSALVTWIGFVFVAVYLVTGHILLFPVGMFGFALLTGGSIAGAVCSVRVVSRRRVDAAEFTGVVLFSAMATGTLGLLMQMEPFEPGAFRGRDSQEICLHDDGTYVQRGVEAIAPTGAWRMTDSPDNDLEVDGHLGCRTWTWGGRVGLHLHDDATTALLRTGACSPPPPALRPE